MVISIHRLLSLSYVVQLVSAPVMLNCLNLVCTSLVASISSFIACLYSNVVFLPQVVKQACCFLLWQEQFLFIFYKILYFLKGGVELPCFLGTKSSDWHMTALSDWDCLIVARMHGVDFFYWLFWGDFNTTKKCWVFFVEFIRQTWECTLNLITVIFYMK